MFYPNVSLIVPGVVQKQKSKMEEAGAERHERYERCRRVQDGFRHPVQRSDAHHQRRQLLLLLHVQQLGHQGPQSPRNQTILARRTFQPPPEPCQLLQRRHLGGGSVDVWGSQFHAPRRHGHRHDQHAGRRLGPTLPLHHPGQPLLHVPPQGGCGTLHRDVV